VLKIEVDGEHLVYQLSREKNEIRLRQMIRKVSYSFPVKYIIYPFRRVYYSIKYHSPLFGNRNNRDRYKPSKYKGYLVFNKPKYLPSDTLKCKAFITNKNGKPINKELKFYENDYFFRKNRH
jgi:hypothetical protein